MSTTAIALAALFRTVLVSVWWSRPLFRGRWMKLTAHTDETMRASFFSGAVFALLGSVVMATVFDWVLSRLGLQTALQGAGAGLALWVGLVLPPMLSPVVYEGKSFELFLINTGFQLTALLGMGGILGARL